MIVSILSQNAPPVETVFPRGQKEVFPLAHAKSNLDLTQGVIWKQLLLFLLPIAAGTLFQQLYSTVDAVIVGQFVGADALAAVGGSAAVIVQLVVGVFTGLSSGATVVIPTATERKTGKNSPGPSTPPSPSVCWPAR